MDETYHNLPMMQEEDRTFDPLQSDPSATSSAAQMSSSHGKICQDEDGKDDSFTYVGTAKVKFVLLLNQKFTPSQDRIISVKCKLMKRILLPTIKKVKQEITLQRSKFSTQIWESEPIKLKAYSKDLKSCKEYQYSYYIEKQGDIKSYETNPHYKLTVHFDLSHYVRFDAFRMNDKGDEEYVTYGTVLEKIYKLSEEKSPSDYFALYPMLDNLFENNNMEKLKDLLTDVLNCGHMSERAMIVTLIILCYTEFPQDTNKLWKVLMGFVEPGKMNDLDVLSMEIETVTDIKTVVPHVVKVMILIQQNKELYAKIKELLASSILQHLSKIAEINQLQGIYDALEKEEIASESVIRKIYGRLQDFIEIGEIQPGDYNFVCRFLLKHKSNSPEMIQLLYVLAETRDEKLWQFFPCMLSTDLEVDEKDLKELCLNWLKVGICSNSFTPGKLACVYQHYNSLISCAAVKCVEPVVTECEEVVQKHCLSVSIANILLSAGHIPLEVRKIFILHAKSAISTKLKQDSKLGTHLDSISVLLGNEGGIKSDSTTCRFTEEPTLELLIHLLKDVGNMFGEMKLEEKVTFFESSKKFWKRLFTAEEDLMKSVCNPDSLPHILQFSQQLFSDLNNFTILYGCLMKLQEINTGMENKIQLNQELSNLIEIVSICKTRREYLQCDDFDSKVKECKTGLHNSWQSLIQCTMKFISKCHDVETLFQFIDPLAEDNQEIIPQLDKTSMDKFFENFTHLKEEANQASVQYLDTENFWKKYKLGDIGRIASENKKVIQLEMFRNFLVLKLQHQDEVMSFGSFCKHAFGVWKDEFTKLVTHHIVHGNDIEVKQVQSLFKNVTYLEAEYKFLREYIPSTPCDNMCQAVRLWMVKDKLLQNGRNIIALMKLCTEDSNDLRKKMKKLDNKSSMDEKIFILQGFTTQLGKTLKLIDKVPPETMELITELISSQVLLPFLIEIKAENLLDLINAVDEHAEGTLNASTVIALISLQKSINPFLIQLKEAKLETEDKDSSSEDIEKDELESEEKDKVLENITWQCFIQKFSATVKASDNIQELIQSAKACAFNASALINLKKNVSGNKIVTKEFVRNTLATGAISIESRLECTRINVTLAQSTDTTQKVSYDLDTLNEIKKRAFLLKNTLRRRENTSESKSESDKSSEDFPNPEEFTTFIDIVDAMNDIDELLQSLHGSGHILMEYVEYQIPDPTNLKVQLQTKKEDWTKELENWKNHVKSSRIGCQNMNYLYGEQFRKVHQCLTSSTQEIPEEAIAIIQYIFPGINNHIISNCRDKTLCVSKCQDIVDCLHSIEMFLDMLEEEYKIEMRGEDKLLKEEEKDEAMKSIDRAEASEQNNKLLANEEEEQKVKETVVEKEGRHKVIHKEMKETKQDSKDKISFSEQLQEKEVEESDKVLETNVQHQSLVKGKVHMKDRTQMQKDRTVGDLNNIDSNEPLLIRAHHSLQSIIPVILEVYKNRSPYAQQVLFCRTDTSIEEIEIFIERCYNQKNTTTFYSLVNVENLDVQNQHRVLNILQNDKLYAQNKNVKLVVIYRGKYYDLAEDNQETIKDFYGLDTQSQKNVLKQKCPNIFTVTSDLPGQGKTEHIYSIADAQKLGVKTVLVSGSVQRSTLLNAILECQSLKHHLLHINIQDVTDKEMVDNFFYELLVLGNVSAGSKRAYLSFEYVAIEIANTVNNYLVDELHIISKFSPIHLTWKGFQEYLISEERLGSVQIVAKYFKADQNKTVDHINISLDNKDEGSPEHHQKLLETYCSSKKSYSMINSFVETLAVQLKQFSQCDFLKVGNLRFALLPKYSNQIRSQLLEVFLNISEEFTGCVTTKQNWSKMSIHQCMLEKVRHMKKWEDSNHLIAMFHSQECNTLIPFYRDKEKISQDLQKLFEAHMYKPLPVFDSFSQREFEEKLEMIACPVGEKKTQIEQRLKDIKQNYSLTTDNILKMALVLLRIRSKLPVILMGETGCGKTTLIKYLALTAGANLEVFSLHAGTTESDLVKRVAKTLQDAEKLENTTWLFFDEINTCDHLGLLTEMLCHRKFHGAHVCHKVSFLAACNPYIERKTSQILTSGLKPKQRMNDILSQLVYRVHPLPERLEEYIWDYGNLKEEDELSYINSMLDGVLQNQPGDLNSIIPKMVFESHQFLRCTLQSSQCVSLRDVARFRSILRSYSSVLFTKYEISQKKGNADDASKVSSEGIFGKNPESVKPGTKEFAETLICLSLSLCFKLKIHGQENRKNYWIEMANILYPKEDNKWQLLEKYVEAEQDDIIRRLNVKSDIAKTSCLKENVFAMFTSILSKIPIFILGKPGCSKSLSVLLLKESLRGKDSTDPYFRTLPQLFVIPYTASEVSTSDEIEKIFRVAARYKDDSTLMPVVLLDEIGLAENSPYNPLKVLHNLLEPHGKPELDIGVIGISNWALDAAKMNRALYLSVPDMTFADLTEVAKCLCAGTKQTTWLLQQNEQLIYEKLARLFTEYLREEQHLPDFHGMRDFYALVKYVVAELNKFSISVQQKENLEHIILKGIQRNLGGTQQETVHYFCRRLNMSKNFSSKSTKELLNENLEDHLSRHLMVIYEGAWMSEYVEQCVCGDYDVIVGSKFPNDQSDNYNYMVLSKIILAMEKGSTIILKDLSGVYGSLYDMLNQNYTKIGKDRYVCRISMGAHSNPSCEVHTNFKCVVMMNKQDLPMSDPPFLNRFEKQFLKTDFYLGEAEKQILLLVNEWVKQASSVGDNHFTTEYAFPGFTPEVCGTLVSNMYALHKERNKCEEECKSCLIQTMPPDAILRLSISELAADSMVEVNEIQTKYFESSITNKGVADFLSILLKDNPKSNSSSGLKLVIYTHSSVFSNLSKLTKPLVEKNIIDNVIVHKLSSFKSEAQLTDTLDTFLSCNTEELLIIQVQPSTDIGHLHLVKHVFDGFLKNNTSHKKHVCFMYHINKRVDYKQNGWQSTYFGDWLIYTLDSLQDKLEDFSFMDVLKSDVTALLQRKKTSTTKSGLPDHTCFHDINRSVQNNLNWAFCCLKNQTREDPSKLHYDRRPSDLAKLDPLITYLCHRIIKLLTKETQVKIYSKDIFYKENWQVKLAYTEPGILQGVPLINVWKNYLEKQIQIILAYIVFQIEEQSSWACLLDNPGNADFHVIWCTHADKIIRSDLKQLPPKIGPQSLEVRLPVLQFKSPFCRVKFKMIETHFIDIKKDLPEYEEIFEENCLDANEELIRQHKQLKLRCFSDIDMSSNTQSDVAILVEDFYNEMTAKEFNMVSETLRKVICAQTIKRNDKLPHWSPDDPEDLFISAVLLYLICEQRIKAVIALLNHCQQFEKLPEQWLQEGATDDVNIEEFIEKASMSFLLPAKDNTMKSLAEWQQRSSMFMSFVSRVGYKMASVELLKIFHDLTDLIYMPHEIVDVCYHHLEMLKDQASIDHQNDISIYISSDFFDKISEFCEILKLKGPKVEESVKQFMCLFFGRCIQNTTESSLLPQILDNLSTMSEDCPYIGTVLHQVLLQMDDNTLYQILNRTEIDDVYVNCLQKSLLRNHNSKWEILICDVLQKQSFCYIDNGNDEDSDSTDEEETYSEDYSKPEFIRLLTRALNCVSSGSNDKLMEFLVSIAYIRNYLSWLARDILNDSHTVKNSEALLTFDKVMKEMQAGSSKHILNFFLKLLKRNNFQDLQGTCKVLSTRMTLISELPWVNSVIAITGIDPFVINEIFPGADEVQKKIKKHTEKTFPEGFMEQLCLFLSSHCYITRFQTENWDECYDQFYSWIKTNLDHGKCSSYDSKHCKLLQRFCLCLMGKSTFNSCVDFLNPQHAAAVEKRQLALFTIKLLLFILPKLTVVHLMLKRTRIKNLNIITNPDKYVQFKPDDKEVKTYQDELFIFPCHKVVASSRSKQCPVPQCNEENREKCSFGKLFYEKLQTTRPEAHKFVDKYENLIELCCIIGGLGISENKTVSAESCIEQATDIWKSLLKKSGCKHGEFEILMHTLLEETIHLFLSYDIKTFEIELEEKVAHVMASKDKKIHRTKEIMYQKLGIFSEGSLEKLIEEVEQDVKQPHPLEIEETKSANPESEAISIDAVEIQVTEASLPCLKSHFRYTEDPSISGLKSAVTFSGTEDHCQLLKIIASMESYLKLVMYLPNILKWVNLSHQVSQKILSKKDAQEKTVDLILKKLNNKAINSCFGKFSDSWSSISEEENWKYLQTLLGIDGYNVSELPRLSSQEKYIHCIIPNSDFKDNVIYKVICVLQKVQNTFLLNVLMLCMHHHNHTIASKILGHNSYSSLKLMPIHESRSEHILQFQWPESYKYYSQNPLNYGRGHHVQYDTKTLETEIGMSILPGKPILQMDEKSFPFIVFKDDAYDTTGELLAKAFIIYSPQEKMPDNVVEQLQEMRRNEPDVCDRFIFALQLLLSSLEEKSSDRNTQIFYHIDIWFKKGIGMEDCLRLFRGFKNLKMCHLIDFYEHVESYVAQEWQDMFRKEYREKLEKVSQRELTQFLQEGHVTSKEVLSALEKVVGRHIVKPHPFLPHKEPTDALGELLRDPYVWSYEKSVLDRKMPLLMKKLPTSLAVKHIIEAINFISQYEENKSGDPLKIMMKDLGSQTVGKTKKKAKKKQILRQH